VTGDLIFRDGENTAVKDLHDCVKELREFVETRLVRTKRPNDCLVLSAQPRDSHTVYSLGQRP